MCLSEEDFKGLFKELSQPWDENELFEKYKVESTKEHAKLILNLSAPSYKFDFS